MNYNKLELCAGNYAVFEIDTEKYGVKKDLINLYGKNKFIKNTYGDDIKLYGLVNKNAVDESGAILVPTQIVDILSLIKFMPNMRFKIPTKEEKKSWEEFANTQKFIIEIKKIKTINS